jgi:hypothetical protein
MSTKPPRINAARAIQLLKSAVKGKEDYVYDRGSERCLYVKDGQPSCLVGHALVKQGWPIADVASLDSDGGIPIAARTLNRVYPDLVSPNAARIFSRAQIAQDGGETWGSALNAAIREGETAK